MEIVLTCRPQVPSWIHFNFCNFIPQLSQVETDRGGQRHEGKDEQQSKQAALADVVEREASHLSAWRRVFLQGGNCVWSVFLLNSDCAVSSRFYSSSWAGLGSVYVACSSVLDPVEIVSDEVGLAGVRLWLCVFYARHDSWGQMFGFTKETM